MIALTLLIVASDPVDHFMGAAYERCVAGDDSNPNLWKCGDALLARDKAAVERTFNKSLAEVSQKDFDPEAARRLKAEQRAWRSFRDVACRRFQVGLAYGSMGGTTDVYRCLHTISLSRIAQLDNPTSEPPETEGEQ